MVFLMKCNIRPLSPPTYLGFIAIALITITLAFSCQHEPDEVVGPVIPPDQNGNGAGDCHPDTVYFQQSVLPLLIQSCGVIGCHDPGTAQDGVVLTDYTSIINTGDVRPGRPDNSDLYEVITDDDEDDRMPPPPRDRLTADQIKTIETWILQGALNNACEPDCDPELSSFSGQIWPAIQQHCLGCHSGSQPEGGISLSNHAEIAAAANSGQLMGVISWQTGFTPMPLNGNKLSDCEIEQFNKWIQNGTPDD